MITKQRLEELIEQGTTIYDKHGYKIDLAEKDNFLENIFSIYFKVEQNKLYRMNKDLQIEEDEWYLQNLFETEEDARWELEMTATRTETLKLPKWEEFEEILKEAKLEGLLWQKCKIGLGVRNSQIVVFDNYGRVVEYFGTPNEENYIEACRLCKKLFLGEEV